MAQSAKKVNFMISEEIRVEFEKLVPAGLRSRVVNEALRKELALIKRKRLTKRLMQLSEKSPVLSTEVIVEALRKERTRPRG